MDIQLDTRTGGDYSVDMKEQMVRLSVRVPKSLADRVEKAADKKRWSVNVYLEEALLEKLAYEEPLKKKI